MGYLRISDIRYTPCLDAKRVTGLLGWARCTIEGCFVFDGITVRCDRDGNELISFPSRRDGRHEEHPYIRPTHPWVRAEIQEAILRHVHAEEGR
jgi:DNA-binding cell septation regulator SpoVG